MDNTNRFDKKAEIYAKSRPKYALELLDYLKSSLDISSSSVIADIGSGTGIFTEQLLSLGCKVFGVEPNDDMRKKAEEKLITNKNFISFNGNAESTGLEDNSIDLISASQAFHWFNENEFKSECKRILKPDGKVAIIYNSRDENAPCTKALYNLRAKYNPEFHGFSNGINSQKCIDFFDGNCDIFSVDNTQIYNRQNYINRVLSSSYSLKIGDKNYEKYLAEINEIFDTYSSNGFISIPTKTIAYTGTLKSVWIKEKLCLSEKWQ